MSSDPNDPIPLSMPSVGEGELANLRTCIETNWVSSAGPFVSEFENRLADYTDTSNAVATVSGTSALHLALIVAGVAQNDEVLVSTLSFIAPANAVAYIGAKPVFVDADPTTWQMSPDLVEDFLRTKCERRSDGVFNSESGRRVAAILPVHILGGVVELGRLLVLGEEFGLPVIEDATEGLGATYQGKALGSLGQIGCFSFNGNKLITCGGGGMIVTDNKAWAQRARHLSTQAKSDPAEYIHDEVGFNYRLTNLQAAMGCAQMDKINQYLVRKKEVAQIYKKTCSETPGLAFMPDPEWSDSMFWLSSVLVDQETYGLSGREVIEEAQTFGMEMRPLWQPLHHSPAHEGSQVLGGKIAEDLFRDVICIPSSVGLSDSEVDRVVSFLRKAGKGKAA